MPEIGTRIGVAVRLLFWCRNPASKSGPRNCRRLVPPTCWCALPWLLGVLCVGRDRFALGRRVGDFWDKPNNKIPESLQKQVPFFGFTSSIVSIERAQNEVHLLDPFFVPVCFDCVVVLLRRKAFLQTVVCPVSEGCPARGTVLVSDGGVFG